MSRLAHADVFRSLSEPLLRKPRVICAYCHRELAPGNGGELTSHGCCEACAARMMAEDV
jgi:hypothetical protein